MRVASSWLPSPFEGGELRVKREEGVGERGVIILRLENS
jgi:hypothetical protein